MGKNKFEQKSGKRDKSQKPDLEMETDKKVEKVLKPADDPKRVDSGSSDATQPERAMTPD